MKETRHNEYILQLFLYKVKKKIYGVKGKDILEKKKCFKKKQGSNYQRVVTGKGNSKNFWGVDTVPVTRVMAEWIFALYAI